MYHTCQRDIRTESFSVFHGCQFVQERATRYMANNRSLEVGLVDNFVRSLKGSSASHPNIFLIQMGLKLLVSFFDMATKKVPTGDRLRVMDPKGAEMLQSQYQWEANTVSTFVQEWRGPEVKRRTIFSFISFLNGSKDSMCIGGRFLYPPKEYL
ncbi:hypothetical protein PM082_009672 [Marasmius tenuissimus]|nr:hypothetical protein PM082_009672 [Marasmius tenuissimus]